MSFKAMLIAVVIAATQTVSADDDAPLVLYGAGSLKASLSDVVAAYEEATGHEVRTAFGPSGLMRQRIESGELAHVFASANMAHPEKLQADGRAGPVRLFARNKLCAIAQDDIEVTEDTLLEVILRPDVRLGTSTPGADPSGDYAWALFGKAESIRPGSRERLENKALKLTGGPTSRKPPEGRNQYAWVMDSDRADVFLTYCTNAVLARREMPSLQIVSIPAGIAVGADYGLTVLDGAPADAESLADFILAPEAQSILERYGFEPAAADS